MESNVTPPLDADDPEVEHAMKMVEHLSPAQRDEFLRTAYRYIYAYRRTRDPNLLIELANSFNAGVVLYNDPEYISAVAEVDQLRKTSTGRTVDARELVAEEQRRRAG